MNEMDKSTELIFNLIIEEACKSDEELISMDEVSERAEEIGYRVFKRVILRLMEDKDKRISELEVELNEIKREFPMQNGPPIPWYLADEIYRVYSNLYGRDQSLERLAERGGFGWSEIPHMTKKYKRLRGMGSPWPKVKEKDEND